MIAPESFYAPTWLALLGTSEPSESAPGAFNYSLVLAGALALVCLVILLWAVKIRKPPRQRRRKSSTRRNPTLAETEGLPPVREEPPRPSNRFPH